MPRKKTVQPAPKETIYTEDFVIEIRDKDTREIGRGKDKEFDASELDSQVLHGLVDMYQSADPRKRAKALDLLESPRGASRLAKELELWGYELSDRALREHAHNIRREWSILMAAKRAKGPPGQSNSN
jgi:hypothetical protein